MRRLQHTASNLNNEQLSGWRTIRRVAPYLWPADPQHSWVKYRVVFAMLALILAKVVAVWTPLLYKNAVDSLADAGVSDLAIGAVGLTLAYGGIFGS